MEELFKKLDLFEIELMKSIRQILSSNPTSDEVLLLLISSDFDTLLQSLGYEDLLNEYNSLLDGVMFKNASGLSKVENAVQELAIIKEMKLKDYFKKTDANIQLIKTRLGESIVGGIDARTTLKNLESIPLRDYQTSAFLNTAYADFNRIATAKVYESKPEQRFMYTGGTIPTSSKECAWLMKNQRKEGYTKAEIDKGIETPFTYTSGDFRGQKKKIYWTGRLPNFNCIHTWEPIDKLD